MPFRFGFRRVRVAANACPNAAVWFEYHGNPNRAEETCSGEETSPGLTLKFPVLAPKDTVVPPITVGGRLSDLSQRSPRSRNHTAHPTLVEPPPDGAPKGGDLFRTRSLTS
ncbi:hypothetical protein NL676_015155 [Syzygium grande]|nr:hypothetical protein NL676_015155 [Syzygium grande]